MFNYSFARPLLAILFAFMTMTSLIAQTETGQATFYADKYEGLKTASGEPYRSELLTAAHPTYEYGTVLRVTNLANGKTVNVRVNDRGPYYKGRIVELSKKAAQQIGLTDGTAQVKVQVIKKPGSYNAGAKKKPSSASININDPKVSAYGLYKVSSEKKKKYAGFGVQIGVFSNYKNVLKQVSILQDNKIFNVLVSIEKASSGKDIYKIYAGPYSKVAEATAMKSKLRRSGFAKCFVVELEKTSKP